MTLSALSARPPCADCACPHDVHTHYRGGDDCGRCGPTVCPAYRSRPRLISRARAALRARRHDHTHADLRDRLITVYGLDDDCSDDTIVITAQAHLE